MNRVRVSEFELVENDGVLLSKRISLGPRESAIRVEVSLETPADHLLEWINDLLLFCPGKPDFTWLPQVKYTEENICPDWSWKSPAVILQRGGVMCAVIPDLLDLRESGVLEVTNAVLDLDVRTKPLPTFSCGLAPAYPHLHSLFRHLPGQRSLIPKGRLSFAYYLLLRSDAPPKEGYRPVVAFLWDRFGRPALLEGHATQQYTFSDWAERTWGEYADRLWFDLEIGGDPCGSLASRKFGADQDAWFCAWWNVLRTAHGFIPSYIDADLVPGPETRLNQEGAEPAACALFLAELSAVVGEGKYLVAAAKAAGYLQRNIVPEGKWFDYETFLSCSPKPYDFYDQITDQHPQNNMGTIMTASAFLRLHLITLEEEHLRWGERVLDYLSLTQQVWSHPRLTPNLIGGFTTQNSDAEWSDARQAYCASFPVAPAENWAHTGYVDALGADSGFHWGQGSGMASVEMVCGRYGGVLVDLTGRWAVGVNGCTVRSVEVGTRGIELGLVSALRWPERLRLVFRNPREERYALSVNGVRVGRFASPRLQEGVSVSPPGLVELP